MFSVLSIIILNRRESLYCLTKTMHRFYKYRRNSVQIYVPLRRGQCILRLPERFRKSAASKPLLHTVILIKRKRRDAPQYTTSFLRSENLFKNIRLCNSHTMQAINRFEAQAPVDPVRTLFSVYAWGVRSQRIVKRPSLGGDISPASMTAPLMSSTLLFSEATVTSSIAASVAASK